MRTKVRLSSFHFRRNTVRRFTPRSFDWDPAQAASNAAKHGVTFEVAMTVFRDPLAKSILDRDSAPREERWVTLGATTSGNLLVVVHTWNDIDADRAAVRIISARRPTAREARQYREDPL